MSSPWEGQEGALWQGRLPGLGKEGWEPGSIPPPPHPVHTPQVKAPAKCLWLPALPGLCPLLSCPSVEHKGYRKHEG